MDLVSPPLSNVGYYSKLLSTEWPTIRKLEYTSGHLRDPFQSQLPAVSPMMTAPSTPYLQKLEQKYYQQTSLTTRSWHYTPDHGMQWHQPLYFSQPQMNIADLTPQQYMRRHVLTPDFSRYLPQHHQLQQLPTDLYIPQLPLPQPPVQNFHFDAGSSGR